MNGTRGSWPAIRAGCITVVLLVGLVDGLPLPGQANARVLPALVAPLARLREWRERALHPFGFISSTFALTQRWSLFASPSRTRYRMWIEARADPSDPFALLYRVHDPSHRYLADVLEYRRVRGIWNPTRHGPGASYTAFSSWVARRVFKDQPSAREVRIRMERVILQADGGAFVGTGEFSYEERVRREDGSQ